MYQGAAARPRQGQPRNGLSCGCPHLDAKGRLLAERDLRRQADHSAKCGGVRQGSGITLTWAATTRQPSGMRIQVCICRPSVPGGGSRNSVDTVAASSP